MHTLADGVNASLDTQHYRRWDASRRADSTAQPQTLCVPRSCPPTRRKERTHPPKCCAPLMPASPHQVWGCAPKNRRARRGPKPTNVPPTRDQASDRPGPHGDAAMPSLGGADAARVHNDAAIQAPRRSTAIPMNCDPSHVSNPVERRRGPVCAPCLECLAIRPGAVFRISLRTFDSPAASGAELSPGTCWPHK